MEKYADIIIDIAHEKVDRPFQYRIPASMENELKEGMCVKVPFGAGNKERTGYCVAIKDKPEWDVEKIKDITEIVEGHVSVEDKQMLIAAFLKRNYGSTMIQAIKTVIPAKKEVKAVERRFVHLAVPEEEAREALLTFTHKKQVAKVRLLAELLETPTLPMNLIAGKLHVTGTTVKALEKQGIVTVEVESSLRNPVKITKKETGRNTLSTGQKEIVDTVLSEFDAGVRQTYLLHGITGSGKTEVYMNLIEGMVARGKQAIVLIPEIALTYQTLLRFYTRFGDRVSVLNSTLSQGEKYDQCERAKRGEIDVMIGPRSALFTPFPNIGLIIMDEEQESSYKSENAPKYHAREVAEEVARLHGGSVLLGSATPSMEAYYRAKHGEYKLFTLKERLTGGSLPTVYTVDLREELKNGNRSIFSEKLKELMTDRLQKKEQIMLFLNRRGYAGFVSCRSCGHVMKCPHCDVSLSEHRGSRLVCHYCGYSIPAVKRCPECGSPYISGFRAGTQQIEDKVKEMFPEARVLRMDADTTGKKESYEEILSAFANREADILIGTQMIVKGHDFSNVTLVGVLAADMSLHVNDFHAAERTFALLTQAAGRAGRGKLPGNVVIQTYDPDHYAIRTAKEQDYEAFYDKEIEYRRLMNYPPVWNMLLVHVTSPDESECGSMAQQVYDIASQMISHTDENQSPDDRHLIQLIGPADATIAKVNDIYRKVIYMKTSDYAALISIKDGIEQAVKADTAMKHANISFDFNPMSGF